MDYIDTMAYAGQKPWHEYGFEVSNDLSPEQMMKAAKVDWLVDNVPCYFDYVTDIKDETGQPVIIDGQPKQMINKRRSGARVLIRMDTGDILDNISDGWNPTQNWEAFEFFHEFVEAGHMKMHTAGSIKGGQYVWCLAEIVELEFALFGKDNIKGYMLFVNPHKYGAAIRILFTPIRVVCWNTLMQALSLDNNSREGVRMTHRRAFDPDLAKQALGLSTEKFLNFRQKAEFISTKFYKPDTLKEFFGQALPLYGNGKRQPTKELGKQAATAFREIENQPGFDFGAGTWWSAFNKVTHMVDHEIGKSTDTRIESAWFGDMATKKLKALELAVEFAEAS